MDYLNSPFSSTDLYAGTFGNRISEEPAGSGEAEKQAGLVNLREAVYASQQTGEIIGRSRGLKTVLAMVSKVAPTDTTVLLQGETGTGKELIARAVHRLSPRAANPLVRVNCGALPADLIESELFGHERGAFTGATQQKTGRFEWADGGTLFLDEIGELPLALQVKLLRVLESGEFERVGGRKTIRVNVRLIAATNRKLEEEIRQDRFRVDLYYRLNVFPIHLPPLRERREDIPRLIAHFVQRFNEKMNKDIRWIPEKTIHALCHHAWPGNVRELENVIERAVIVSGGRILRVDLPEPTPPSCLYPLATMEEVEREHIIRVLHWTGGIVQGAQGAASILGLNPSTLRSRMQKLGIRKSTEFRSI